MRIDNATPFLFGFRFAPLGREKRAMTAIVRATFNIVPDGVATIPEGEPLLAQGFMSGETYRDDDEQGLGECLYPGDFADFKKNADVLLRGTCHVPNGQPIAECPVRFSVGNLSKILQVVGPRVFTGNVVGNRSSSPIPFTRMPLDYAHAYGGPGYDANPIGKGFGTNELPNIEYPGEEIRSPRDQVRPACFGPINPQWKSRNAKRGKRVSFPREIWQYADDFDVSFFQSAPADQQLSGYLKGDEEIILQNLHAQKSVIRTRLPGLRQRIFVHDAKGDFREVSLVIDTLFVDADRLTVTLTYRGITPVNEFDLSDIRSALVDTESSLESPKPIEHYRRIHQDHESDPYQIRQRMPEHLHEVSFDVLHHGRLSVPVETAEAGGDPVSKYIQSKIGHLAASEQQTVRQAIQRALNLDWRGKANFMKELEKGVVEAQNASPPGGSPIPGVVDLNQYRVSAAFNRLRTILHQLQEDPARRQRHSESIRAIENLLADPRFSSNENPKSDVEPGPGQDLSGRDFSGLDLRGRDFHGANLTGAIFTRADARGANFRGAILKQAVLTEANFSGADLTLADMTQTNSSRTNFTAAKLGHTNLHQTMFSSATLDNADLQEARAEMTIFQGARLSAVQASRASFNRVLFRGADLQKADFSSTNWNGCELGETDLTDTRFDDALLTKTTFMGAKALRTKFTGARGQGSSWMNATLIDADFKYAAFDKPNFNGSEIRNTQFYGANLRGAQFFHARLEHVDMSRVNLAGANLAAAQLTRVDFHEANLYETTFINTAGRGCNFQGANLKRSSLEFPQ